MSSRSGTVVVGLPAQARRSSRSRSGLLCLSEKQIQAYLAARDVLRRIQRTNTLVLPPQNGAVMAAIGPRPLTAGDAAARRESLSRHGHERFGHERVAIDGAVLKMIGHVPEEAALLLLPIADKSSTVIGLGTVKTVYAPEGRDESVVTVEITPQSQT